MLFQAYGVKGLLHGTIAGLRCHETIESERSISVGTEEKELPAWDQMWDGIL